MKVDVNGMSLTEQIEVTFLLFLVAIFVRIIQDVEVRTFCQWLTTFSFAFPVVGLVVVICGFKNQLPPTVVYFNGVFNGFNTSDQHIIVVFILLTWGKYWTNS